MLFHFVLFASKTPSPQGSYNERYYSNLFVGKFFKPLPTGHVLTHDWRGGGLFT